MESRIWELRKSKGLSTRDLAKISGVSKATINRLENNKFSRSVLVLEKIANSLECSIGDLFKK